MGKGVTKAVDNLNKLIAPALVVSFLCELGARGCGNREREREERGRGGGQPACPPTPGASQRPRTRPVAPGRDLAGPKPAA
jgi:hypothetical protein